MNKRIKITDLSLENGLNHWPILDPYGTFSNIVIKFKNDYDLLTLPSNFF